MPKNSRRRGRRGAGGITAVGASAPPRPEEVALREAEELRADRERLAMWAEEERARSLRVLLERYLHAHGVACSRRARLRRCARPQRARR